MILTDSQPNWISHYELDPDSGRLTPVAKPLSFWARSDWQKDYVAFRNWKEEAQYGNSNLEL